MDADIPQSHGKTNPATVVASSHIGTPIEFYELFVCGTTAALVFPQLFSPALDPRLGLMASCATLAVPFTIQPIGAIVFGHCGDTVGRKKMLILALLLMGLSTFAIGLVPGYDALGTWLLGLSAGKSWSVSLFLLAGSLIALCCAVSMRDTSRQEAAL